MYSFWIKLFIMKGTNWVEFDPDNIFWDEYYESASASLLLMIENKYIEAKEEDTGMINSIVSLRLTDKFINEIMNGDNYE